MAFPHKNWLGKPKGWQIMGNIKPKFVRYGRAGDIVKEYRVHLLCGNNLMIMKENNEIFYFCPICMVKMRIIPEKYKELNESKINTQR